MNTHQLARFCIEVLRAEGSNYVDPYRASNSFRSCLLQGVTIYSITKHSIGCIYEGKKYSFLYLINEELKVVCAYEPFLAKRFYFGKGY